MASRSQAAWNACVRDLSHALVRPLMPAFIAPLVGFVIGIGFAWAAADELSKAGAFAPRPLTVVALFALLVFAPACAYFLAFEGDWAFAYLLDTRKVPSAVDLALVLLDAASVLVGFLVAAPRARARKILPVLSIAGVPALVAMVAVVAMTSRLSVQATYAQFHGDFGTRGVSGSALGYGLLWMNGLLVMAIGWNTRVLRKL